jgi:sulfite oxidase
MPSKNAFAKLLLRSETPLNAEPPLSLLAGVPITPLDAFFIRTHGTVPCITASEHRLRVGGRVRTPLSLSLDELRREFPSATALATLLCAGNRREELKAVATVAGTGWQQGAVGNAEWRGVRLGDVLQRAGCEAGDLHVAFASADEVVIGDAVTCFGGSIPLAKALAPEVLLAYEMNGEPLTPEHGFPLRVVVPGYIGARSVKWLTGICVQEQPSENYFQQHDYKLLLAASGHGDAARSTGVMLGELPVNSAILAPADGSEVEAGKLAVEGYAIAGGGRAIGRVDVSIDGGATWREAAIEASGPWAWALWHADVELPPGPAEIVVRAWDSAAQTQPERLETVWNRKGYMNNAWHRITVTVRGDPGTRRRTARARAGFELGEGI